MPHNFFSSPRILSNEVLRFSERTLSLSTEVLRFSKRTLSLSTEVSRFLKRTLSIETETSAEYFLSDKLTLLCHGQIRKIKTTRKKTITTTTTDLKEELTG